MIQVWCAPFFGDGYPDIVPVTEATVIHVWRFDIPPDGINLPDQLVERSYQEPLPDVGDGVSFEFDGWTENTQNESVLSLDNSSQQQNMQSRNLYLSIADLETFEDSCQHRY